MNPNAPAAGWNASAFHRLPVIAALPNVIANGQPQGTYGIAYDLYTRQIEDNPPRGYAVRRSAVYRQMCRFFRQNGYAHDQYSIWQKYGPPADVWRDLMRLRTLIEPRGIICGVTRAMQIQRVMDPVLILTNDIIYGGQYAPGLLGITPRDRVQGVAAAHMPPGWATNGDTQLPPHVKRNQFTRNGMNWRHAP